MIKVVAKCIAKKDKIEKFKTTAEDLINKTRQETGNISYGLYQDTDNPQILTFIEEWKDQQALDLHIKSDHFERIVSKLNKLQTTKTKVNVYKLIK